MDEYAIRRLMLRWPMAANDPSAMDACDMKTMICCHWPVMPGNASMKTRVAMAMPAILGAAAKNAVTGVGEPSYTSGVHIWNGTAEILNAMPAATKTRPKITPLPTLPCSVDAMTGK